MKRITNVCKKAIAAIEIAALTMALVGGISFMDVKEVKSATDNELTLNEGVSIASDGEEVFTFTAPADGTYYFYSQSEDSDMVADLITETQVYFSDDGFYSGYDFMIEAELSEGETCELYVNSYSGYEGEESYEYQTTIYVCDEATATTRIVELIGGRDVITAVGESCELRVEVLSLAGNVVDELPEGYSVKWFKSIFWDEEIIDLQRTGLTYNIDEVLTSYLYTPANDYVRYFAVLYKDEVEISSAYFKLTDYERSINTFIDDQYAYSGEEVTFTVSAYDYDDEEINLDEMDNYTYQWYKVVNEEIVPIEGETGYSYTFEASEDDFHSVTEDGVYYICEVFIDEESISSAEGYLYNKDTYIDVECPSIYVAEGEDATVVPAVYDYEGEGIDLYDENLEFVWIRYNYSAGEEEIISTEPVLVIENYTFDEEDDIEYSVTVTYKNQSSAYAWFDIYSMDYAYNDMYVGYALVMGDSVTLMAQLYDNINDEIKTEFEDTFTFEWYKVAYDEDDEAIYSDILGTESTYGLEVDESDFWNINSRTQYECKVYNNGKYIASFWADITNVETYWDVDGDDYYVSIGDTVTFVPEITDYYGNEIDLSDERFSYQWYVIDWSEDSETAIGNDSTYTIDAVAYDDLYDAYEYPKEYVVKVYDAITNETMHGYFELYEGERPIINLIEDADWETYVGSDWAYCDGSITGDNGIIEGNFATTGGGWEDAVWGIQAQSPIVEVDKGDDYVYSAKILSNKDMTMRIKVSNINDGEISYETIDVKANEEYYYSVEFNSPVNYVKIAYALGAASTDETVEDVEFTIFDHYLAISDIKGDSPEEPSTEEVTTKAPETTTVAPTTKAPETTVAPTTAKQEVKKPAKAKIKKTYAKKKASKVAKIKIKKVKGAKGYQVQISKSKKFKSKNILVKKHTTKLKPSIKSKKLKNKKKLYVRVRAYVLDANGDKVYGKWSKAKRVKIK